MKTLIIITSLFISLTASANPNYCAGNSSEKSVISGLLGKINPFGTWKGIYDGSDMIVVLSQPGGQYKGTLAHNGSNYGPLNIKLCDYGTEYSVIVSGYEAMVSIVNKNKIIIEFNGESVTLKRQ